LSKIVQNCEESQVYLQSWSLGQNLRDRDETLTFIRNRDFEQKVETRPRLKLAETETKHETFETKCLQNFKNFLKLNFGQWTF